MGANLVRKLNQYGYKDIIIIDNYDENKFKNIKDLLFVDYITYNKGLDYIDAQLSKRDIGAILHVGANADVLNRDPNVMMELNYEHSKYYLKLSIEKNIPLIYASSSAVYGNSKNSIVDNKFEDPHNTYSWSKWMFDRYVIGNSALFNNKVIGLRFFNIFGYGEFHKEKNASLPYRFFSFIAENGFIDLFDKEIKRDYVWVEDVADIIVDILNDDSMKNGIYNLGTGNPISHRSLAELVRDVYIKREIKSNNDELIKTIPMPESLIHSFQFYTKAENVPELIKRKATNNELKIEKYINQLISDKYGYNKI